MPDFRWICCLNPVEYAVTLGTAFGLQLSLFVGMPYDDWLGLWVPFAPSLVPRQNAFIALLGLEIVTIEIDEVPVVVVRPQSGYLPQWVMISLHIDTTIPLCPDGCTYPLYP